MGLVTVKIKKPKKGWAYHGGEVAELPAEAAKELIDGGYAIMAPATEGDENPLPEDLPSRDLLFENGLETIEQIIEAKEALTDITGIGGTIAKKIVDYIEEHK